MSFDSRAKKRIREAKKKARPGKIVIFSFQHSHTSFDYCVLPSVTVLIDSLELSSSAAWVEQGYHNNFKSFTVFNDSVERISVDKVTPQQFIDRFEKPYKPVCCLDSKLIQNS